MSLRKKTISLRIPYHFWRGLEDAAKDRDISRSSLCKLWLYEKLKTDPGYLADQANFKKQLDLKVPKLSDQLSADKPAPEGSGA